MVDINFCGFINFYSFKYVIKNNGDIYFIYFDENLIFLVELIMKYMKNDFNEYY